MPILGSALGPVGALAGGAIGAGEGNKIETARDKAIEDEANRQQFNNEIFQLADSFSGRVANNPFFDFDQLQFQGDDPRQQRLQQLVNIFTNRSQEVQQQIFEPGVSQTRLSLLG